MRRALTTLALLAALTACSPSSTDQVATTGATSTAPTTTEAPSNPIDAHAVAEGLATFVADQRAGMEYAAAVLEAERAQARREAAREAEERRAATTTTTVAPAPTGGVWDRLAQCESNGNWHINTGNGYYGGLQFSLRSWRWVGGTGYPHEHSREVQIEMGRRLQALQGWGAWPACSRKLGLR